MPKLTPEERVRRDEEIKQAQEWEERKRQAEEEAYQAEKAALLESIKDWPPEEQKRAKRNLYSRHYRKIHPPSGFDPRDGEAWGPRRH